MTQQSENQFKDDLTGGMEGSNTNSTDSIDMFDVPGDESPIARLKAIILSIDWEINNEILQQLEDELLDLGDIWAGEKIKLVYVQGLSKIGKYIYKEKAGAHPNAINLLIRFYHNLEKIVISAGSMSEDEKKQLLKSDVQKFDQLKSQIAQSEAQAAPAGNVSPAPKIPEESPDTDEAVNELKVLKAQVLGIDWEINDQELQKLGSEVKRLETVFAQNKPKLILLQGIGALSAYINKMRSKSNSKAFTLLHSFYDSIEKISGAKLPAEEEKQLLLTEVAKFNDFKADIASAPPAPAAPAAEPIADEPAEVAAEDEEHDEGVEDDVSSRLASVFGDDDSDGNDDEPSSASVDEDDALEGVNVETEADDDSDEDALPYADGSVAPALSDVDEDSSFSVEKLADDLAVAPPTAEPESIIGDDIEDFDDESSLLDDVEPEADLLLDVDVETEADSPLGVDVESEADDDSDEDALPTEEGELAPALAGADDDSGFDAESMASEVEESDSEAIENRLGAFFDDEVESSSEGWSQEEDGGLTESSDEVQDDTTIITALSDSQDESFDGSSESESEEVEVVTEEDDGEDLLSEDDLAFFDDDSPVAALTEPEIETEEESDPIPEDVAEQFEQVDVEDVVEEQLTFLDDEDDEPDEIVVAEEVVIEEDSDDELEFIAEAVDEQVEDENVEDSIEDEMLFSDEESEIEVTETHIAEEDDTEEDLEEKQLDDENVEESLEEELSFLDDDDADDDENIASTETTSQSPEEDALAFFDEALETDDAADDESLIPEVVEDDSAIEFDVESETLEDDDEIEFTVPGEETAEDIIAQDQRSDEEDDDIIEFDVPGAGVASAAAFLAGSDGDDDSEELVFEAVADDVEVDPLPGEEFVDFEAESSEDEELFFDDATPAEILTEEGEEVGESALSESTVSRIEPLAILTTALQGNIAKDGVQDVLSEVNKLRSSQESSFIDKTFLQLMSTLCQATGSTIDKDETAALMQDIVSGLELNESGEASSDSVNEHLFHCTSRLLLLQQKALVSEKDAIVEDVQLDGDSEDVSDSESSEAPVEQEQLASLVQREFSDIRNVLTAEIAALRKEIADKIPE